MFIKLGLALKIVPLLILKIYNRNNFPENMFEITRFKMTGVFDSFIIFSLWSRVVKLMAKWHRASTRAVSGGSKSHL